MKVLVLGGGGREHALVWAIARSKRVQEVVCAPGNGGIAALARCVAVDANSLRAMLDVVAAERPDLVVVGPEVPLALGIVDALTLRGVRVFGPTQAAAQLESSKAFAKDFMQRWAIPTAAYRVCASVAEVTAALDTFATRVVVKADGLAAGKGVILCATHAEAIAAAAELFSGSLLGSAVESVVLEEMLEGPEISFFAICDGRRAIYLAAAQDHKRIGEGDTGPNTGGMGAYSSDDLLPEETRVWLLEHVAQRVVDGMRQEGTPFSGVLFTGLMMTPAGPRVLEFNTRFGDPETEAILLRLETGLVEVLEATVDQRLDGIEINLKPGASACVIAASAGYPGKYVSGNVISGLDRVPAGVEVFHAGTALRDGAIVTAGGRVLAVTAAAVDLRGALAKAYAGLEEISFEGMQYRRDIGWRALVRQPYEFILRAASAADEDRLRVLIEASVRGLQKDDYTPEQIEGALGYAFGLDRRLIADGTYFVAAPAAEPERLVACGGWSFRRTLFGADHGPGREAGVLDPAIDPATIRAIFVDPGWARRGLGSLVLAHCEAAARQAGFTRAEMGSTLTGLALYRLRGYVDRERVAVPLPNGESLAVVRMEKGLA